MRASPRQRASTRCGSREWTSRARLRQSLERWRAAGISFRALSATAVGRTFVGFLALDSAEDAAKAVGVLKKL